MMRALTCVKIKEDRMAKMANKDRDYVKSALAFAGGILGVIVVLSAIKYFLF